MDVLCGILKKSYYEELSPPFLFWASQNMDTMAGTPAAILDYEENLGIDISVKISKT